MLGLLKTPFASVVSTMVSRLTVQLLQKLRCFNSPQTFSHIGLVLPSQSQTVCTLIILSLTLDNALSDFSGLGKTMSKRSAMETLCISPTNKKQKLQAANIKLAVDEKLKTDKMFCTQGILECGDCKEGDCASTLKASSVSSSQKDDSSAAEVLDDSGIEVTPGADRVLTGEPNMPGFRLVECKSFPAPSFDFVSSDPSNNPPSAKVMVSEAMDKNPMVDLNIKQPETLVSGIGRGSVCTWEERSVVFGDLLPASADLVAKCSQPVCVDQKSDATLAGDVEAKVFTSARRVEPKVLCAIQSRDKSQRSDKCKEVHSLKRTPKGEPVALGCKRSVSDGNKLDAVSVTPEYNRRPVSSGKGKQPAVLETGSHAKPHSQSESCTTDISHTKPSAQSRTKTRQGVTESETDISCRKSSTHKPKTAPTDDCRLKPVSKKRTAGKVPMGSPSKKASTSEAKKGKQTVLPASLLNQVVKTVQENIRTISTQVVAASASKALPTSGTLHTEHVPCTDKLGRIDKGTLVNSASDVAGRESVVCQPLTSRSAAVGSGDRKRDSEKLADVIQKTADQSSSDVVGHRRTLTADGFKLSTPEASSQRSCESSSAQASDGKACSGDMKAKSRKATEGRNQDVDLSLQTVSPVPLVEMEADTSSDVSKKQQKAKKKRKSRGRRKRKSEEGDGESVLGILPECTLQADSRVSRRKEQVYNLSALFSGDFYLHASTFSVLLLRLDLD